MNYTLRLLSALFVAASASAADLPQPTPVPTARTGSFVFSLLPKSLQRRPTLDFHVITELTPEGRKLGAPTASHPVYYIAQAGAFNQLGNNTPANEHAPDVGELTRAMERALSGSHYSAATPSTPLPDIAVVFNYGSFARFSTEIYDFQEQQALADMASSANDMAARTGGSSDATAPDMIRSGEDRDAESLLPIVLAHKVEREDVLNRASLVGGEKFALSLREVLNKEAAYRSGMGGMPAGSVSLDVASPFHQFINANEEAMALIEESFNGCYFVVASAFDYRAMKKGQKVLLWRTKMTVSSTGISMSESLPSLVVTASSYLGREMAGPLTLSRKIYRDGKVEVGTPTVVDFSDATTAPPADKAAPKSGK